MADVALEITEVKLIITALCDLRVRVPGGIATEIISPLISRLEKVTKG